MSEKSEPINVKQEFEFCSGRINRKIIIGVEKFRISYSAIPDIKDPVKNYFVAYLGNERAQEKPELNKRITYIDLFCGGGGLSLGTCETLKHLGFSPKPLVAVDIDTTALKLFSSQFEPIITSEKSVENLIEYSVDYSGQLNDFITQPKIIDNHIRQFKDKTHLLIGGPPCQGHSNLNNRSRRHDRRNLLYFVMPAFAIALNIPCVIIENVKSITSASIDVVAITKSIFEKHNYYVSEIVLDATSLGVAQTRSRHFLVASKLHPPSVKEATRGLCTPIMTFDEINSNLSEIGHLKRLLESTSDLSDENINRIEFLHENGLYELPNSERPVCHRNGHSYPSVYGRLYGNKPLGTITTGFGSPGRGRYIHPHEPRMINLREAARAQAFPDWYWEACEGMEVNRNNLYKIIGDAVPSLMVTPLIVSLYRSLLKI